MDDLDLLDGLNDEQQLAVTTTKGPVLILAGPGSGKTRVITRRIAYLLQVEQVRPWNILAVTFTNKAAKEMRERLERLVGPAAKDLHIGTFHSICARVLRSEIETLDFGRTRDYSILDEDEQFTLIKQAVKDLNLNEKHYQPRTIQGAISRAKNDLLTPRMYEERAAKYLEEIIGRVYRRYDDQLRTLNAVDFDDLIFLTHELWRRNPDALARAINRYHYIHVDEFQDCNTAQYQLVYMLASGNQGVIARIEEYRTLHRNFDIRNNICVVGDQNQNIYSWRGASIDNIQRFQDDYKEFKKYPIVLPLNVHINYRSYQDILDAATAVVGQNYEKKSERQQQHLIAHKQSPTDGKKSIVLREVYNEEEEGRAVVEVIRLSVARREATLKDCAVMYRTNAQSRAIEEQFIRAGVPYRVIGSRKFYERKEIRDVIAYLRLLHNPRDGVALRRIVNVPARKIGDVTVNLLMQYAEQLGVAPEVAIARIGDHPTMGAGPKAALTRFGELIAGLRALVDATPLDILIDRILERTGYASEVRDGSEEGDERWRNVLELRRVAEDYHEIAPESALPVFLEQVALIGGADIAQTSADNPSLVDEDQDRVTLITLHAAKGTEYKIVFLVGLEEGILPHSRSVEDINQLQEERRLLYVGITRAMERLYLLYATRRSFYGGSAIQAPSRFLGDIPSDLLDFEGKDRPGTAAARSAPMGSGIPLRPSPRSSADLPVTQNAPGSRAAAFMPRDQRRPSSGGAPTTPPLPPSPMGNRSAARHRDPEPPAIPPPPTTPAPARDPRPGDTVSHRYYGRGVVKKVIAERDSTSVEILFERADIGTKTLDLAFAKLEIVG